jgi:hypothetical protein
LDKLDWKGLWTIRWQQPQGLELQRSLEGVTDFGGLHMPDAMFRKEKSFGLAEEDQGSGYLFSVTLRTQLLSLTASLFEINWLD